MAGVIYVIRHGQDTDNAAGILNGHRDTELTELGREQAGIVAQKLSGHNISKIYSSPLKRANETAIIIASDLGISDITIEPDLIERDFGIMTGKKVVDIPKYSKNNIVGDKVLYFVDPEGAELLPTVLKRARRVLKEIQKARGDNDALIVTHGDTAKMIRAAYHGWTWKEGIMTPYLDNTGIIILK